MYVAFAGASSAARLQGAARGKGSGGGPGPLQAGQKAAAGLDEDEERDLQGV